MAVLVISGRVLLNACCADFGKLVGPGEADRWIRGSCCSGDLKYWVDTRSFLAEAFHHGGTLLDVGSANGFLLRCLQEWCAHKLTPFGIEPSAAIFDTVVPLHREFTQGHFAQVTLDTFLLRPVTEPPVSDTASDKVAHTMPQLAHALGGGAVLAGSHWHSTFPATFDFIYWNVWDNCTLEVDVERQWARQLLDRVKAGGRLVLGLYDTPHRNEQRVVILQTVFEGLGDVKVLQAPARPHVAVVVSRVEI